MFRVLNLVIRARFSTLTAPVVFGPENVVKIKLKQFLAVLKGNDKNCTLNCVGIFRVQNQVIRARFSILPALMVFGLGKVIKIRLKQFSSVLRGNDKNCTLNRVGMFQLQNRVILAQFSALPASVVFRPVKVDKIRSKLFLAVLTGNYKNCTQRVWGLLRWCVVLQKLSKFDWYNFKS